LQTLNYNVFAEMAMPVLLNNMNEEELNTGEKEYLAIAKNWKFYNDAGEKGPVVFTTWFNMLEKEIWDDDLESAPKPIMWPHESTLLEALLKNDKTTFKFIDNINTPTIESIRDVVTAAFKKSVPELDRVKKDGRLEWSKFKDAGIRHLLRMAPLSRFHLTTGGGTHVINAIKQYHGPSWRMIVQLTDKPVAYGIYPGGQSGNAGSKYYDNFIDNWSNGKYYTLWVMTKEEVNDKRIVGKMSFGKF
jgi:penicillin amidase